MARKSFGELLADMARYNPRGIAVTCGATKVRWNDLNAKANRFANALTSLGVKKGDHVSIMFHDCPEFIEANYAAQKIGAVPIPMNFRFVAKEIEYQVNHSDSTVLIFEDLFVDEVLAAKKNMPRLQHYICLNRSGTKAFGMIDYENLISHHDASEPEPCTDDDDICTICYTGGTTGLPKGVVLTYSNFWHLSESLFGDLIGRLASDEKVNFGRIISRLINTEAMENPINRVMASPKARSFVSTSIPKLLPKLSGTAAGPLLGRITGGLSMFLNMPLFHMANYQILIIGPMSGLPRYIIREGIHFDPKEVLETIERERPMVVICVPTQWKMILNSPEIETFDTGSVLVAMTGAGVNPAETKKEILRRFRNSLVVDIFGQTEMTPDTTIRIDATEEGLKNKSVGRPLAGIEMRIVDENGLDVAHGETGEILYRSATIMKEYYGEKEKTAQVIRDGWFYSGDLGYIDPDGELIVVDRKGECISTGGEKVFPHEVEEILSGNEKVDSVCVIGIPDEIWGQKVRAVVVLKDGQAATEEEIIAWSKSRMTGFKRPKSIVFANSLPLSPVGKVLRSQVKGLYGKP
ncbi:MAG TPA: AMP-binding protein [Deltaproteobacteria bacterium]|nr:AMP-binding protein [Deltaproteobacteria bacterium]HPR50343.1 AMP-binding protein [Deltaproteobacteria bacterium]